MSTTTLEYLRAVSSLELECDSSSIPLAPIENFCASEEAERFYVYKNLEGNGEEEEFEEGSECVGASEGFPDSSHSGPCVCLVKRVRGKVEKKSQIIVLTLPPGSGSGEDEVSGAPPCLVFQNWARLHPSSP